MRRHSTQFMKCRHGAQSGTEQTAITNKGRFCCSGYHLANADLVRLEQNCSQNVNWSRFARYFIYPGRVCFHGYIRIPRLALNSFSPRQVASTAGKQTKMAWCETRMKVSIRVAFHLLPAFRYTPCGLFGRPPSGTKLRHESFACLDTIK